MGIIATIVVGLVAGLLASWLMKAKGGILVDLILGVVGGFLGGWLTGLILGKNLMTGINIQSVVVGFVGAVIVLAVYRLIRRAV